MKSIVDVSAWPIVITKPKAYLSAEDLTLVLAMHDEILSRKEFHVGIADLSELKYLPDSTIRRRISNWLIHNREGIQQYSLGLSLIITNRLIRGGLTAVHWISPPTHPTKIVAEFNEGFLFVLDHLEKKNITITPAINQLKNRHLLSNVSSL